MSPIKSNGKIFKVAAVTSGLLMLVYSQARSASTGKLFTESWQDHEQCEKLKGSSGTVCTEVSGGKFSIKGTISGSTPGASGTLSSSLLTNPSTTFDITLGGYSFQDTMSNFKVVSKNSKTTATRQLFTQKCNAQGNKCANFKFEQITLTITNKGVLDFSITAVTGSDANGDKFENSIDAKNFDGEASGPVTDNLSLDFDLGSFTFNTADTNNSSVTGTVQTKPAHAHGSSVNNLSNIKIAGTFKP